MQDHIDRNSGAISGPTPEVRLLKAMTAVIAQRQKGLVHYTQDNRRMTIVRGHLVPPFGNKVLWEDCSSMVTGLFRMAGLHDPNEFHFSGQGFTGTLCLHGRKLRPWDKPRVGDLVFYGHGGPPWHHVAMVESTHNGVKVFSHGHEGGPLVLPIDYRSDRGQIRRYFK